MGLPKALTPPALKEPLGCGVEPPVVLLPTFELSLLLILVAKED